MDRKAKRNKEVHIATVEVPAGTKVRDLMTGEVFSVDTPKSFFGWYTLEKLQWFYWTLLWKEGRNERLVMVRRDKVAMKSGTHRVVHREVVQKRI